MNKRNIILLWGIALLQGMVFYAPVATLYRQAAGLGIFHITLIESISLGLTICLEIPWGWAADRIGCRKTMLICCSLYFVSKLVFWKAEGFGGFLLERILLSVVCAGLSGVDSSLLYLSCGEQNSHRVFSIYENLGQTGILLSAAVYALFVGEDYRLAAFLTVLSYGVAAVLSLGLQEVSAESSVSTGVSSEDIWTVLQVQLKNPAILLLLVAMALFAETHQTITVFLSQLQYVRSGMSHKEISVAYILVNAAALTGGFSAGMCERTGTKVMGVGLLGLSAISCLLMGCFPVPVLSVLGVLVLRGCFGLMQPLYMDLQNKAVTTRNRATALSINGAVMDGLGILLNLIYGKVAQLRLNLAMYLGAVLCAAAALLYWKSFRKSDR